MTRLSIIILSYNTKEITLRCLNSLYESVCDTSVQTEIIVIDNDSQDQSGKALLSFAENRANEHIQLRIILNKENCGFTKGNNQGLALATGEYVLFLNSDVLIETIKWDEVLSYLDANLQVGALTVSLFLPNRSIDPASHRGFPTIMNSFFYFCKLEAVTKHIFLLNRIFGGYHLVYKSLNALHEIDSPSGAFFLARKSILSDIHGFDEDYFMYGEDLDLAYRIKKHHYQIMYYPWGSATHLKYQSGLSHSSKAARESTKKSFYDSMKIFYRKHYAQTQNSFVNAIVLYGIDMLSYISKKR